MFTIVENAKIRIAKLGDLKTVVRNQEYPSRTTDAGIKPARSQMNFSAIKKKYRKSQSCHLFLRLIVTVIASF